MFVPCVYAPACLGGANHALAGQFLDENDKHDLALVALAFAPNNKSSSNATADNIAALSTCSEALGFQLHSRLCHACNSTSRRLGNNRCTICPGKGQNWTLMVLGALFGCTLLAFIVSSTIQDAGKQALSTNVQKILLNYLVRKQRHQRVLILFQHRGYLDVVLFCCRDVVSYCILPFAYRLPPLFLLFLFLYRPLPSKSRAWRRPFR
jgi:hypothetical protein